jgi:DNA replication protein DnaC
MPTAVCPQCNGTGYKIIEREDVSGAVQCECVAVARAAQLESNAGIPPLYSNASFENFSLRPDNSVEYHAMQNTFLAVRGFAREFPATLKAPGLLLTGYPGSGKTHLAVAAFRAILAKGFPGLFFDYQNLLDRIRSGYDAASNSTDKEAYRIAMEIDVLLLDDLGAHRVTDWVMDTVTSIITARCNQRKPIIVTTNLIDEGFGDVTYRRAGESNADHRTTLAERIGERARSRLFEMCRVVKMPLVSDYRLLKQVPR